MKILRDIYCLRNDYEEIYYLIEISTRGSHQLARMSANWRKKIFSQISSAQKRNVKKSSYLWQNQYSIECRLREFVAPQDLCFSLWQKKHCFLRFDIFLEINYSSRNKKQNNTKKLRISFWSDFQRFNNFTNFGRRNYFRKTNQRFHKDGNEAK